MIDTKQLTERYMNDANFYHLVQSLESIIHDAKFTPSELRDALFYATWHYEINHVKPIFTRQPPEPKEG